MFQILGFWIGVTVAAWAVVRIRRTCGAVYEYRGYEWLLVPYYLALGVWRVRGVEVPRRQTGKGGTSTVNTAGHRS